MGQDCRLQGYVKRYYNIRYGKAAQKAYRVGTCDRIAMTLNLCVHGRLGAKASFWAIASLYHQIRPQSPRWVRTPSPGFYKTSLETGKDRQKLEAPVRAAQADWVLE